MSSRLPDYNTKDTSVKRLCVALTIALGAAALPSATFAQEWPARPVKIIAPFAPGGSADTLGRVVAEQLSDVFKQQFFVENKPGAGGVVGSQVAAHAEPDGYTFVISGIASHVIAPIINSTVGYDPLKDFTHVAYFGGPPIVIIVNPKLGVKTLQEMIDYAKKSGEKLTYASPGAGTNGHLVAEYFAKKAGITVEHVPYRGAAPGVTDVVGGHLRFGAMTWTTASGHIRAGTVLPLAVSSKERLPDFPDVPTLNELGYPDLVCTTWFSLSGPPGLPADIVQKLNSEVIKALQQPAVQKRLQQDEILTEPMDPAQFTAFVGDELARWKPIAEHAGFKTN
jgi:tripartite-type tricarboxylate transporter receptor subunit TctC